MCFRKKGIYLLLILFVILTGCMNEKQKQVEEKTISHDKTSTSQLIEDRRIYEDEKDPLTHLYVTIVQSSSGEPYTFYDMNHWYDLNGIASDSPKLDVIVQEGTADGPGGGDILYEKDVPNSTIEIRGNSTRAAPQKSYKIKLLDSAGLWNGQKTLNLNKHQFDITRFRNKLSFDYYTLIPDMASLRTQFVQLHIKDLTKENPDTTFVDYGLYTHVEQVNERYLASRGLDPNGNLYKASNFEFYRYPDQLKLESDPEYKKEAFESILEIKGSKDHTKLLKMLDDVNNEELNINDVFDQHFDRDNYLTWVATNILFGNNDTNSQNFYLYSPLNSNKWYFLPWDYDGAWGYNEDDPQKMGRVASWQSGISNYWGVVLHKRFFKDPKNIKALNEKIEDLSKIINQDQTKKFIDQYYPIVKPFVTRAPDINYLPLQANQYDKIVKQLPLETEKNKTEYYKKLENPMPIFLGEEKRGEESYEFTWDRSFDLQGDEITYDFELSRDPSFTSLLKEERKMAGTSVTVSGLAPGRYFWRVVITDSKNNKQIGFDKYENEDDVIFNGVRELIVR